MPMCGPEFGNAENGVGGLINNIFFITYLLFFFSPLGFLGLIYCKEQGPFVLS